MLIEQALDFLNKSDVDRVSPEIRHVAYENDGTVNIQTTTLLFTPIPLRANKEFTNLVMFAFLDALVDRRQPDLEGQRLRQKYDAMAKDSDFDLIFREVYRLFIVVRNASVHAQSSIQYTESGLQISYSFNRSQHQLDCSNCGVRLINSLILLFARSNMDMDKYLMAYASFYYRKLLKEISNFSDDIGVALDDSISPSILTATTRSRVSAPNYHDRGSEWEFKRFDSRTDPHVVMDEYFLRIGNKKFIIPGEALDHKNRINRGELFEWVVKDTNYLCSESVKEVEVKY